jgi:hypothetical protein
MKFYCAAGDFSSRYMFNRQLLIGSNFSNVLSLVNASTARAITAIRSKLAAKIVVLI